jgi:hypothetical protein
MAVYTNDLRLKEIATGDESGTWGTSTNTNLSLIAEAFSFGTEAITTNADTHTTTLADGSTDPGRSIFLKYTGTLDSACTITIGPNTVSKLWLIENATSGGFSIIIKQGSGATVTVANGQTKAIYSDGAGSGGAMVDAFQDLSIPDLFIDDDLTFTSDSAVITFGADGDTTLTHTDGSGLTLNSTNKLMFNDASQFIQGSSATVLSLGATDEIDLTATAIDVNGTMDVSGAVTANAGISIDNITIDGTEIDLSSGDLTIDVAGDITLDAGGANINFSDDGTAVGHIEMAGQNLEIKSKVSDKDILLKGNDGGSEITALTLDMSAGGAATFNKGVSLGGDLTFTEDDGVEILARQSLTVTVDSDDDNTGRIFQVRSGASGSYEALAFFSEDVGAVFNEDGLAALDFRVESNGNTHMLFVDAGNDTVVIGSGSITAPSTVDFLSYASAAAGRSAFVHGSGDGGVVVSGTGSGSAASLIFGNNWGSDGSGFTEEYRLIMDGSDDSLQFKYNGNASTALTLSSAGAATFGGTVTANSGVVIDNITIDGTEIDLSSGDLTLDVAGDIIFDADGGDFRFKDAGTQQFILDLDDSANSVILRSSTSDGDMIFQGNDGGSNITALTLDMSAAGEATFNAGIKLGDGHAASFGAGGDLLVYHSSNENIIQTNTSDQDLLFKGNDGGSSITALTLDMSAAGIATFNSGINIGNRGSASDPTLQSAIDPDTGVFWGGSNILGFASGGSEQLRVSANGVEQATGDFLYNGGGNFDIKHTTAGQNIVFSTTPSGGSTAEVLRITSDGDFAKLSGSLTIDVAGNIKLDADDAGEVRFLDGGTQYAQIKKDGNNALFQSIVADGDFLIQGVTGSSFVTAVTFDMSSNGSATFGGNVICSDIKASGSGGLSLQTDDGTKRLFINDSGDVLTGSLDTTLFNNTSGGGVNMMAVNRLDVARAGDVVATFNRMTDDGQIIQFYQAGSQVGSIKCRSSGANLQVHTDESGIDFGGDGYLPMRGLNIVDNDLDIGSGSFRYDDIFATNGTIQTSDRNEKQDIEALSDAEQRVAVAAKSLLRKYRYKSAVEEKGDDARIHFGIIAQDLQDAFTTEGLDAARYAMFCSDTWWEAQIEVAATEATETSPAIAAHTRTDRFDTAEEAPEGAVQRTRLGVRYSELLAFIISAI